MWSQAWLQQHQQKAPSGLKQKRIKTTGFTAGQSRAADWKFGCCRILITFFQILVSTVSKTVQSAAQIKGQGHGKVAAS